jgi:Cys-rich repeat protein
VDTSATGGRAGSPIPATTGAGGSSSGAGGAGADGSSTGGGGSAGSTGNGGSLDAGIGGQGGSTTGGAGAGAGGASAGAGGTGARGGGAGSGAGGAGGGAAGAAGAGGSTAGAGGAGGSTGGNGGGSGTGGSAAGSGGNAGASGNGPSDASPDIVDSGTGTRAPGACGGVTCGAGQDCCMLTAKCFDLTNRAACPKPPLDSNNNEQCGSNSDCPAGQFCESNTDFCTGPGFCQSQSNCGWSQDELYCGCNGISYPNMQSACAAGARRGSRFGAGCGMPLPSAPDAGRVITLCGLDSQCPTGNRCCALTGQCYDPVTESGVCALPPAGTRFPCMVDSDCSVGAEYCAGATCSGPGGCKEVGGNCNGELSPVCGCNGKNYMNASCADVSGARVRHSGYCTDADAP